MLTRREPAGWHGKNEPCMNPEHNPPMFMVYEPGEYEWTCDSCGLTQRFTVPSVTCAKYTKEVSP